MMDNSTGTVTLLDLKAAEEAMRHGPPAGHTLLWGTEADVQHVSRAVKLGNREMTNRAQRRKQQKASRKRNR